MASSNMNSFNASIGSSSSFSNRASIGDRSLQQELVELLRKDPQSPIPWVILGYVMEDDEEIQIDDTLLTKQSCFIQALNLDQRCDSAWNNLGFTLCDDETISFRGKNVTNLTCFQRALHFNPKNTAAWSNLGFTLLDDEIVSIRGKHVRKLDCFLKAISLFHTDTTAWNNAGKTIEPDDLLDIGDGRHYSKKDCFLLALKHDPTNSAAWYNLALLLEEEDDIKISENIYSRCGCLVEAINEDPVYVDAWVEVAVALPPGMVVQVENRGLGPKDCVGVGLKIDPDHVRGWEVIAGLLEDDETFVLCEGDPPLTKQGCLQKSEKLDAEAKARGPRRRKKRALIKPELMEKQPEFIANIEARSNDARSWYGLARTLGAHETIWVSGKEQTKLDCYVLAAETHPSTSCAWNNIAALMLQQHIESVEVDNLDYRPVEAFARAAANDVRNKCAWNNLAKSLRGKEPVMLVGNVEVDRAMALKAAEGIMPTEYHIQIIVESVEGLPTPESDAYSDNLEHARLVIQSRAAAGLNQRHLRWREILATAVGTDMAAHFRVPVESVRVSSIRYAGALVVEVAAPLGTGLEEAARLKCRTLSKEIQTATGILEQNAVESVTMLPSGRGVTCSVSVRGFAVDTTVEQVGDNGCATWSDVMLELPVPAPSRDSAHVVIRAGENIQLGVFTPNRLKSNEWNEVSLKLDGGASVNIRLKPGF